MISQQIHVPSERETDMTDSFTSIGMCSQMTGVAVMVVGVWCVTGDGRDVMLALAPTPADTPTLIHLAYGLVGAGGLVLLTSILGVWAALKENKCGLGMVS